MSVDNCGDREPAASIAALNPRQGWIEFGRMPRTHQEIDERSVALHAAVAARLRENPELMQVARENLERWTRNLQEGDPARFAIAEWRALIESLTLEEICALLEERSEEANRLRQNAPFAGVLQAREVWEIKRRFYCDKGRA